jgi:integrase
VLLLRPLAQVSSCCNVTREFKALLAAAELPNIRFHAVQHTAATLLLAQGVDPRTIMETLGQSQISLTRNTSHVLPALQADAAVRLDRILVGSWFAQWVANRVNGSTKSGQLPSSHRR